MTTTSSASADLAPNHHASYPAFAGVGGLVAALIFAVGRTAAAELAVRLTGVGPEDDVVDVGCGPGVAVRRAAATGAASVIGVDPAPVMLRVARAFGRLRRGAAAPSYLEGAAEDLPLPAGSASVLWSLSTVHHWRDLDAGLAEAHRVLRPTGRLLAVERLVEPGATGHRSHGWTEDQAQRFADRCLSVGFTKPDIGRYRPGRTAVVVVLATRP